MALVLQAGIQTQAAAVPQWREPWQRALAAWIAGLDPETDLPPVPATIDLDKLDPNEKHRNNLLVTGYGRGLDITIHAMSQPGSDFTWPKIWRSELPVTQEMLKPYGLDTGQLWVPTHPALANWLAWAYIWDRPWNPWHGRPSVARRAAVTSMADLIAHREDIYYHCSGETDFKPPWLSDTDPLPGFRHPHSGRKGFTLTFNAFTFLKVKSVLPEPVRAAWREGLLWLADRVAAAEPMGPENMRLSVPVGLWYTWLGTGEIRIKEDAERWMKMILDQSLSPAGYIRDDGIPDGSYNGISMHRLAEYWSLTRDPRLLETLAKIYELKHHLSLPEPDGRWFSPTHFNARCQAGFANDQYGGRERQFLLDLPESAPFLAYTPGAWDADLTAEQVRENFQRNLKRYQKFYNPFCWGGRVDMWGQILQLPYVLYHQDENRIQAMLPHNPIPVVAREMRITRSFGDEFFVIRRPGYCAIFYAGPTKRNDSGATNYASQLGGVGGRFNGFAGGGLSAFWTPGGGSLILGRMNAFEAYRRQVYPAKKANYFLPGWQDWLNNHVVGRTREGKILTSARTTDPKALWRPEKGELEISGEMRTSTEAQGEILPAGTVVNYRRLIRFDDGGIHQKVGVSAAPAATLDVLYETLPLRWEVGTVLTLANTEGDTLLRVAATPDPKQYPGPNPPSNRSPEFPADGPEAQRFDQVASVQLDRGNGGMRIDFDQPVSIDWLSRPVISKQNQVVVIGRALQIVLPSELAGDPWGEVAYRVTSTTPPSGNNARERQ